MIFLSLYLPAFKGLNRFHYRRLMNFLKQLVLPSATNLQTINKVHIDK